MLDTFNLHESSTKRVLLHSFTDGEASTERLSDPLDFVVIAGTLVQTGTESHVWVQISCPSMSSCLLIR